MCRHIIPIIVLFSALLVSASPRGATAFGLTGAGVSLGYTAPENLDGTLDVGGHLEFQQSGTRLHLQPGLRYWKVDGISDLNLNADAYYPFAQHTMVTPYVGTGLGLHVMGSDRTDASDTSLGLNLFGGLRFPTGNATTFLEARTAVAETSRFAVLGGMTWRFH